ncbi:MAG: tetratricopeptide repeat protein [Candidatus Omnitrophica bacterium]|nr:tetratricopeptide repeat protein [Candidatus Omnitrophota bacterium]
MQEEGALTLEIIREGDILKMSIYDHKDAVSTLRHYSQHKVDFSEIGRLCQEITLLLSRAGLNDLALIRSLEKAAHALWEHLLTRTVKEKLQEKKNLNLLLEIDEELIFIPWELLFNGTNFLSLEFNIGRLVKTKSSPPVLSYRSLGHIFKMLILANPTNDLKSAYLEGVNIRNQFDRRRGDIRIDFKSTNIDRLYIKKNICDYDIVHFAGHCEYNYHNPKESGWVLSDGNFSIQDILRLGSGLSLPALVFSNACHSAQLPKEIRVDGDYQKKSYSLAAAFLFSGVRHYIGSIRKIEDAASLLFAKEFYHHLTSGKSLGLSLRLARLKLARDYGNTALHWANYLLYGDPGFIMFKPKPVRAKSKAVLPKKLLARSLIVSAVAGIAVSLYLLLPTINPSTYILFLRSQRLFAKGLNQEVIKVAEGIITKDKGFLAIYPVLGDTYHRMGDKDRAIKYYFDYMMLAQKKNDANHLVKAYIAIGWFYHLDGEYHKAKDFYEKALNLSRKLKDKLNEAVALRKLAVWNIDKENYDLALELLTKSSEINRQRQHLAGHRYNLACDYFDMGLVFSDKGDLAAAEEFYRKSRLLFEKVNLKNELSDYYFNLGELYFLDKQYNKALGYYLSGLKIDKVQGNKRNLASDYNMIGELYLEMDNFIEAEGNFNQALLIAEEIRFKPDIAEANYNLGTLYRKMGRIKKCKEFLRKAQEIYGVIDKPSYEEVKEEILSLP